ncbi:unnamed protein product [Arctogadus glacialis]
MYCLHCVMDLLDGLRLAEEEASFSSASSGSLTTLSTDLASSSGSVSEHTAVGMMTFSTTFSNSWDLCSLELSPPPLAAAAAAARRPWSPLPPPAAPDVGAWHETAFLGDGD